MRIEAITNATDARASAYGFTVPFVIPTGAAQRRSRGIAVVPVEGCSL